MFAGEERPSSGSRSDLKTKQRKTLTTNGVFIFVVMSPRTELLQGVLPLAPGGYVETEQGGTGPVAWPETRGVKKFRQITTAVADGAMRPRSRRRDT